MHFKALTVMYSVIFTVALGTAFFRYIEGWSWLDSYFFTVVTISTVGYGSLVPVTALGKIGATILIFFGLGIFAVAIQQFALYNMRKREEETEWLVARLGHNRRHSEHQPPVVQEDLPANEDDRPVSSRPPVE